MTVAEVIDVGALLEVVWVSVVAGLAFVGAVSVVVLGSARANTARRAGEGARSGAWGTLALLAALLCAAGVVLAVTIMLDKG